MFHSFKGYLIAIAMLTGGCSLPPQCSSDGAQSLVKDIMTEQVRGDGRLAMLSNVESVTFTLRDFITTSSTARKSSCTATSHMHLEFSNAAGKVFDMSKVLPADTDVPISYDLQYTDDGRLAATLY